MSRPLLSKKAFFQKIAFHVLLGSAAAAALLNGQGVSPLEIKLSRVIVPTVDFKDVTLDGVLDFMAQIPVKTKQMEAAVNIVKAYKTITPTLSDARITLSLTNVPWTELMRYVCLSANVRVNYEAYAVIVGLPPPSPTPTPSPGS